MSNKSSSSSSSSSSEEKDSGKKKGGKKSDNPMDGLELVASLLHGRWAFVGLGLGFASSLVGLALPAPCSAFLLPVPAARPHH